MMIDDGDVDDGDNDDEDDDDEDGDVGEDDDFDTLRRKLLQLMSFGFKPATSSLPGRSSS